MVSKARILDLDGTISDDRWRLPLIDHTADDPWAAYHAVCGEDALIHAEILETAHPILVITSRPESVRRQTEDWLARHGIVPMAMYMRPNGCDWSAAVLKPRLLWMALRDYNAEIECIYDNEPFVLDGYHKLFSEAALCLITNPQ
jgi:hypothetical protein